MPVYNGEIYIEEAIRSILNQTFTDFEFIISDNASTDKTENICRAYAATDRRIKYIRQNINIGLSNNFNHVVELSTGKYFKWVAHDDKHAETFLERCLEAIEKDSTAVLSYAKTKIIDENGDVIKSYNDNLDLRQPRPYQRVRYLLKNINLANVQYGVIRTNALKKTRLIGNYISADYITLLELCILGKFLEVPEYLFFRRDRTGNIRKMTPKEQAILWFATSNQKMFRYPQIRLILEQWKSVSLAEITLYEKIPCYFQLPQWVIRLMRNKAGVYKRRLFKMV